MISDYASKYIYSASYFSRTTLSNKYFSTFSECKSYVRCNGDVGSGYGYYRDVYVELLGKLLIELLLLF